MTANTDLAIDLQHVSKTYRGRVAALSDVSLDVHRGQVFGLLGPNGAGKSTLIKIMMTVVRPSTANGTILGHPVGHKPTLAKVGYLPEHHRFPRYLTGRQTMEFFAALSGTTRVQRRKRSAELIDIVGMTAWADKKVGSYSKGMMQRIGLAQALVNDPDLVLLDEPTDGVDPVGRRDIRDVLASLRSRGKTIFINSHLLSELEMISDRVAIMNGGRIARLGTINDLTGARQRYDIEVASADPTASTTALLPLLHDVTATELPAVITRGTLSTGHALEIHGHMLRVLGADAEPIQIVLDTLRQAGLTIRRVQPMRPSLEELFIEAVSDPITGQARPPGAVIGKGGGARPAPPRLNPPLIPPPVPALTPTPVNPSSTP